MFDESDSYQEQNIKKSLNRSIFMATFPFGISPRMLIWILVHFIKFTIKEMANNISVYKKSLKLDSKATA